MSKIQILSIGALAVASLALSLMLHRRSEVRLGEAQARVETQRQQLAEWTRENERLSNRISQAMSEPPPNHSKEVAKLHHAAESLKQQTNVLRQQLAKPRSLPPIEPEPAPSPRPPEYFRQLHQLAGNKPREAMRLATAFLSYARDHNGNAPSEINDLIPYIDAREGGLSGTHQFEIVYHGALDELQGISPGAVAILRDVQKWIGPEGKPMRVYGMADGSSLVIGGNESPETWEVRHIIGRNSE